MIQELHFKGLSLTPDDHHTAPGELSLCANVELHNGALRPSVINATPIANPLKVGDAVAKLVYVHATSGYKHFIGQIGTAIHWFPHNGSYDATDGLIKNFTGLSIYSINSIGNTLVILTSDGVHYARWQNNKYTYIGSHFPECNLSFGLQGRHYIESENFDVEMTGWYTYDERYYANADPCHDDNNLKENSSITEQVLAHVNKFISTHSDNGKFMFPFFVRYAYRLYDGSLVMHSAPVLMMCNSGVVPYVFSPNLDEDPGERFAILRNCQVSAGLFDLDYKLIDASLKNELKKWDDIIKSVDVFVSRPLYKYDASGHVRSVPLLSRDHSLDSDYCVAKVTSTIAGYDPVEYNPGDFGLRHQRHDMAMFIKYGRPNINYAYHVILPYKSENKFNQEIKDESNFFLLASIRPDYLPTERTVINLKKGFFAGIKEEQTNLGTIYTRELMSDDYQSHDTIIPQVSYAYNSRLNIAQAIRRMYAGYNPGAQFAFTDGLILPDTSNNNAPTDVNDDANGFNDYVQITYLINEDGKGMAVTSPEFKFGYDMPLPYIYYPNTHAYRAIIRRRTMVSELIPTVGAPGTRYSVVDLKPHPLLNGAVYFEGFGHEKPEDFVYNNPMVNFHGETVNPAIPIPNKIYTSEVNNPFYFPVEGINTVGLGSIIGLAATTRALSQGQFGQYPLMAFCTDGIWALDVSATGTFSSIHPISREVCVNPDSICQLDQSVLFATERGLSMVSESNVASISDVLDGPLFDISQLWGLSEIINGITAIESLTSFDSHPVEFFKTAKLLYDFTNARVLIASTESVCAYVYSLKDGTWSTMVIGDSAPLNLMASYPFPYIQQSDGTLLYLHDFVDYSSLKETPGLIITRSLTWSSTMQTICGFQQACNAVNNKPLLIIYGSNDNVNWSYIGKSNRLRSPYLPGHPYRYFRLAILMYLTINEEYSKLLLDVIEKYQKL